MNNVAKFQIDYGTRVSTIDMETISVKIDPIVILQHYAKATTQEMHRMNPERYDSVADKLLAENLHKYYAFLLAVRVKAVRGELKEWRQIRSLWMPAWVQFAISCVGEVILQDYGLKFVPDIDDDYYLKYALEDAMEMSNILRAFKVDGLSVMDDGFPRTKEGSKDTMSLALFGNYVRGPWPVSHPIFTYVAAFLGHKIAENAGYQMLYRCRYDEVNFIASMLLNDEKVLR